MPRPLRVQNLFQGGFTEFRQTKLLLPDGKKCEWYSLVFSLVVYEPQKYARFTFDRPECRPLPPLAMPRLLGEMPSQGTAELRQYQQGAGM